MHVPGGEVANTVVVQAGKDYYLVVLPATYHVKPWKDSPRPIGCPMRLATEVEFSSLFPDCELGAMPPLGELYGLASTLMNHLPPTKKSFSTPAHTETPSA